MSMKRKQQKDRARERVLYRKKQIYIDSEFITPCPYDDFVYLFTYL